MREKPIQLRGGEKFSNPLGGLRFGSHKLWEWRTGYSCVSSGGGCLIISVFNDQLVMRGKWCHFSWVHIHYTGC
ncbi:hypothetical protein K450DRAFT_247492 [Umbelopsis ramanniana AG]|uniref:Uncharacterized protein n=1 Tax=Umbelopsis ramanniana AG TaxID=1314678 RepID=A0AAD5E9Y3_UMBRA|nr:uncharacterized protein K450DRAFT_247492 [Umbelopsis ramanniana AG]KAI8578350.1 hypothetical protein K450DRAFT_247492 [Umbelopsis ramanniana AG]